MDAIQLIPTRDRAAVSELLTMTDTVDVIVPRGGKGLVGLVQREARVPLQLFRAFRVPGLFILRAHLVDGLSSAPVTVRDRVCP